MNVVAGEGQVFVCLACGKRSKDRYGDQKIDRGWDVSCMLNCALFDESRLVIQNGRVIRVLDDDATPAAGEGGDE